MDFDAVEIGHLGVHRGLAVGFHDTGDFIGGQGAWCNIGLLRANQADMAGGGDGAGGDRQLSVQEQRGRDAANMP